ncbi:hypothetical protein FB451DRAFT_1251729 [Mycena latifolia]|nr:hypothetical protein FB451DRAFT_1251729 [Mycena latifolia]
MSGDSEERFYVSKIVGAKVVDKGSRQKHKKCWTYLTEWDGYPDPTWEPEENFMGLKCAIKTFWRRASPKDRNPKDLSKFRTGEVIYLPQVVARKQKPGPGRSSAGLIKGTKVFALWPDTQIILPWFSGAKGMNTVFDSMRTTQRLWSRSSICGHARSSERAIRS